MLVLGIVLGTDLASAAPYTYSMVLPPAPLVATNNLVRFIPGAALALARTIPLGLVILFDKLPSSLANALS